MCPVSCCYITPHFVGTRKTNKTPYIVASQLLLGSLYAWHGCILHLRSDEEVKMCACVTACAEGGKRGWGRGAAAQPEVLGETELPSRLELGTPPLVLFCKVLGDPLHCRLARCTCAQHTIALRPKRDVISIEKEWGNARMG